MNQFAREVNAERRGQVDEKAGALFRTYSGGRKQRLDVAMGLMHRPRVLFLDELTISLPLLFFSSILIACSLITGWVRPASLANPVE